MAWAFPGGRLAQLEIQTKDKNEESLREITKNDGHLTTQNCEAGFAPVFRAAPFDKLASAIHGIIKFNGTGNIFMNVLSNSCNNLPTVCSSLKSRWLDLKAKAVIIIIDTDIRPCTITMANSILINDDCEKLAMTKSVLC